MSFLTIDYYHIGCDFLVHQTIYYLFIYYDLNDDIVTDYISIFCLIVNLYMLCYNMNCY